MGGVNASSWTMARVLDGVAVHPFHSRVSGQEALVVSGDRQFVASQRTAQLIDLVRHHEDPLMLREAINNAWGTTFSTAEVLDLVRTKLATIVELTSDGARAKPVALDTRSFSGRPWLSFRLLPASLVAPISRALEWLFHPAAMAMLLPVSVLSVLAAFNHMGAIRTRLDSHHVLPAYAVCLGITLFHELGHSAAMARYFNRVPAIHFGFSYFMPVMFVRADEIWLGRPKHRLAVDGGGIYFQVIAFIPLFLVSLIPRYPHSLFEAGIAANLALILINLNPLLRFDGYWILSSALGVANLTQTANAALGRLVARLRGEASADPRRSVRGGLELFLVAYALFKASFTLVCVALFARYFPALSSATIERLLAAASALAARVDPDALLFTAHGLLSALVLALATWFTAKAALNMWHTVRATWRGDGV
jgi:hypothetical protein